MWHLQVKLVPSLYPLPQELNYPIAFLILTPLMWHLQVNENTILGAGGEISDFQHIQTLLEELATDDYRVDDGISMAPQQV